MQDGGRYLQNRYNKKGSYILTNVSGWESRRAILYKITTGGMHQQQNASPRAGVTKQMTMR